MNMTAILVDGGFYRKVAGRESDMSDPQKSAEQLFTYCMKHLKEQRNQQDYYHDLYRIFYYDCLPSTKKVYHPLLKRTVDLSKTDLYHWMTRFTEALKKQRKVALRFGNLSENNIHYNIKPAVSKKLLQGSMNLSDLKEEHFQLQIEQKGVDMKIGLDIASLAYKKQVQQIVLISGDSDFVPAAKLARREGIDFVLDPMYNPIHPDLFEHIDGLRSQLKKNPPISPGLTSSSMK